MCTVCQTEVTEVASGTPAWAASKGLVKAAGKRCAAHGASFPGREMAHGVGSRGHRRNSCRCTCVCDRDDQGGGGSAGVQRGRASKAT